MILYCINAVDSIFFMFYSRRHIFRKGRIHSLSKFKIEETFMLYSQLLHFYSIAFRLLRQTIVQMFCSSIIAYRPFRYNRFVNIFSFLYPLMK